MKEGLYISNHCIIANGIVRKDDEVLFDSDLPTDNFLLSAYQHFQFNYPKFYKMDNLGKLGWLAAEVLLSNISIPSQYKPEEIAILLTNANSSLDDDLKYLETVNDIASPSLFVYTLPNIVMGEISIRHKFKGEQAFFVQDEFDASFMHQQVTYLLNNNKAQACICGWVDVLGNDYKAALFFVERQKKANAVLFSVLDMGNIFNQESRL